MTHPSFNLTMQPGDIPSILIALLMAGTFAMEVLDHVSWFRPAPAVQAPVPTITMEECAAFCGGSPASWSPTYCSCLECP